MVRFNPLELTRAPVLHQEMGYQSQEMTMHQP